MGKERKMKIPIVLFVTCIASLNAASLMDSVSDGQCPSHCCDATTTQAPTDPTTDPTADSTTDPTADPTGSTVEPTTTEESTTTEEPTTTEESTTTEDSSTPTVIREATEDPSATTEDPDICSTCDPSTCVEGGAGSASLSLLALLLPPVLARLL